MPASPAKTPYLGLPRLAPDDHTKLWEHHNADVDTLDKLFGPWKTYTPVWSQSDGAILNVGSGSLTGRYMQLGKLVTGQIRLEAAADTNKGSGNWTFTLPPVSPRSWNMVGGGFAMARNDTWYGGSIFPVSSGVIGAIVGDLGRVSNTVPSTYHKAGDWYSLQFVYEAG